MNNKTHFFIGYILLLIASLAVTSFIAYQKAGVDVYTNYQEVIPNFWAIPVEKTFFTYNINATVEEKGPFWTVKEKNTGIDYKVVASDQISVTIGQGFGNTEDWKYATASAIAKGDKISMHGQFHPTENYFIPTMLFLYKP